MRMFELFDSKFLISDVVHESSMTSYVTFSDSSGAEVMVSFGSFDPLDKGIYGVCFTRAGKTDKTGDGEEFKIFSTVIEAIDILTAACKPQVLFFGADISHGNRSGLYKRMVSKFAHSRGFSIREISQVDDTLRKIGELFTGEDVTFLISPSYQTT